MDIAFLNGDPAITDPYCPVSRADIAPLGTCGDGVIDALDVTILIEYAFLSGPGLCDPCAD